MLLVFDLDGTLIDSRRDLCTGINLMRRHYQLPPLPVETVAGFVGDGVRKLVARALFDAPHVDFEEALNLNRNFYHAHLHDETTLYPGVAEGLPQLASAGHRLAIISNKPHQFCVELLEHFQLRELFQAVMGGDSVANLKPHPEALQQIMQTLSAAAHETWMIGDSRNDILCAQQAGARSAFVTYGIGKLDALTPDLVFNSFDELTAHFMRTAQPQACPPASPAQF